MPGQRYAVGATHLCARSRDRPHRLVEVDFRPFGGPQFAGPRKQQRHKPQRRHGGGLAVEAVNGSEQRSKRLWFGDRRTGRWRRFGQRSPQRKCRVNFGPPRRNGEAKHATNRGPEATGGFVTAPYLDLFQDVEDFRWSNVPDLPVAQRRIREIQQPFGLLQSDGCSTISLLQNQKLASHGSERGRRILPGRPLLPSWPGTDRSPSSKAPWRGPVRL